MKKNTFRVISGLIILLFVMAVVGCFTPSPPSDGKYKVTISISNAISFDGHNVWLNNVPSDGSAITRDSGDQYTDLIPVMVNGNTTKAITITDFGHIVE